MQWEYVLIREFTGPAGGGDFYILPDGQTKKYSGVNLDGQSVHYLLNHFGKFGYELVDSATSATHINLFYRLWVFKRPKVESNE